MISNPTGESIMPSKLGLPLIGPHEGRELELMLRNEKKIAYFSEYAPEEEFRPHVESGKIIRSEWKERQNLVSEDFAKAYGGRDRIPTPVIFALSDSANLIDSLLRELEKSYKTALPERLKHEAKIGRILGYNEEAIEAFLAQLENR